jgi:two-component system sensor histidine kinase KdpD
MKMNEIQRPDPDELLKKISPPLEETPKKGRLKIFFGFCAGVGKTYRMLQEAQMFKSNGKDVVIGIVESHKRQETEDLLTCLEIIPRKKIEYSGITLEEMDLDAIIQRKPEVVLVDELAHSNVKGSRHSKRYQDVEEILNSGMDVFTTLNVQHIESLIDVVYQSSGIKVQETVPDKILEMADEVQLVDLTLEKLMERLKEGKVYIPDKAKQAMQKFFRKGNLLVLRELALKYTAKHVDEDVRDYIEKNSVLGPLPIGSKILVGITASPTSEKLIRFTNRLAADLEAEWYAVYVESPQQPDLDEKYSNQLQKNIRLAEELGAKVISLSGNIIADEIVKFARQKNVTLIVAGLSQRSRLKELVKGSVLNRLIRKTGSMHVLIVGKEDGAEMKDEEPLRYLPKQNILYYLYSFLLVALTVFLIWIFRSHIDIINAGMILLLPVIVSSYLWGVRIGLFSTLIAVGSFDFFFVPPYLTFSVANIKYFISFGVFVCVSLVVSILAKLVRWKSEKIYNRELFIYALYSFSREMMAAKTPDEILQRAAKNISEAFDSDVLISMPENEGNLEIKAQSAEDLKISVEDKAVAQWVFQNMKKAGKNTDTLSSAKWLFLPLKSIEKPLGVLGLKTRNPNKVFTSEQCQLLESFASIISLSISKMI